MKYIKGKYDAGILILQMEQDIQVNEILWNIPKQIFLQAKLHTIFQESRNLKNFNGIKNARNKRKRYRYLALSYG